MKRFAIIIGCSGIGRQYRSGIEKDVDNFIEYLQSNKGGAWNGDEILSLKNKPKTIILDSINNTKGNYDYVLVMFSGHGNYSTVMNERRLYTNDGEFFYESDILGMASKQLTIIDSCACEERELIEDSLTKAVLFASESVNIREVYRRFFDDWVESCPNQSIMMYSCDEGEESSDSDNGGLYAYNLIVAAKNSKEELNCLKVHEIVKPKVVDSARKRGKQQHPTYYSTCKHGNVLPFTISLKKDLII